MAAKKVLIITYYWPPAGGAGVQRWLKMAKYLPEFGVLPAVLTVDEAHASYPVIDPSFLKEVSPQTKVYRTKSFEPLRLYGKLFGKKKVPYSGFANVNTDTVGSKLSRWVRGNFFIPDARKGWNRYALPKAKDILKREKIETVITTGPPHSTHLIGLALKNQNPALHWIADFRDPWTDIYYYEDLLHSKRSKAKDASLEKMVLRQADIVLSVCPSNHKLLSEKLDKPERAKVKLVTNGFDEEDFEGMNRTSSDRVLKIGYTGTLAQSYDVFPIFTILAEFDFPWRLTMAGNMAPEIREMLIELKIEDRVELLGHVLHKDALKILRESSVLLHILPNTEKTRMGTTGKLFEYIGSGTPIINFGPPSGDSAQFIRTAGAGETFNRNDKQKAMEFLRKCMAGDGFNQKETLLFSRKNVAADFTAIIAEMEKD